MLHHYVIEGELVNGQYGNTMLNKHRTVHRENYSFLMALYRVIRGPSLIHVSKYEYISVCSG